MKNRPDVVSAIAVSAVPLIMLCGMSVVVFVGALMIPLLVPVLLAVGVRVSCLWVELVLCVYELWMGCCVGDERGAERERGGDEMDVCVCVDIII